MSNKILKGGIYMDSDILMAMLGNITQELSNIKSELGSIDSNVSDNYYTNHKLDKIIELLEKLIRMK